jgi:hypothetical protein
MSVIASVYLLRTKGSKKEAFVSRVLKQGKRYYFRTHWGTLKHLSTSMQSCFGTVDEALRMHNTFVMDRMKRDFVTVAPEVLGWESEFGDLIDREVVYLKAGQPLPEMTAAPATTHTAETRYYTMTEKRPRLYDFEEST